MAITCKCIQKHRDKQGKIYGYTLVDDSGKSVSIYSDALKGYIKDGTLVVTNLTLTDDNRLVDKTSKQVKQAEEKGVDESDISINKLKMLGHDIKEFNTRYGVLNIAQLNKDSILVIIPDNIVELAKLNDKKSKTCETYQREIENWVSNTRKDSLKSQLFLTNQASVRIQGGERLKHLQSLLVDSELDTLTIDGSKLLNVENASKMIYKCKRSLILQM